MSILATLICGFLLWPFLSMWRAYCILTLWGWFVLPATGINAPSMYLLVGALMTLHLMLPIIKPKSQEGDAFANYMGNALAYGLAWPGLVLLSGWVWRWLQWGLS
jgi:hypothetical protein